MFQRLDAENPKDFAVLPDAPVLLTGFDPFGGATSNPSWELAQRLDGAVLHGAPVVTARLPTVFGASLARLQMLLDIYQPSLVLCLGVAQGRSALSLERVAINLNDARIPDNVGQQPIDTPVINDAPAAYFSSLPVKAMYQAIQGAGVAVEVSQSAGTYVCNHVMFGLLHALASRRTHANEKVVVRGGFMHIPASGMPLALMEDGLRAGLIAALKHTMDINLSAGAVA